MKNNDKPDFEHISDDLFNSNISKDNTTVGLEFIISANGYFDVDAISQQLAITPTRTRTNVKLKELSPEQDKWIDVIQTDWRLQLEQEKSLDTNNTGALFNNI